MKMKNINVSQPNNLDANKKKKCSCEDKYGPKPFSNTNDPKSK